MPNANAAAADDDESDDDSEPLELESERVGETGDVGIKGTDPCQCVAGQGSERSPTGERSAPVYIGKTNEN